MQAWEAVFYSENRPLRPESEEFAGWPSSEAAWAFTNDGLALAQRLADELGTDFEVETDGDPVGRKKVRLHTDSAPTNPHSATSFRHLAEQSAREFGVKKEIQAVSSPPNTSNPTNTKPIRAKHERSAYQGG
jgi:hypothetical protein